MAAARAALQPFHWKPANALARTLELRAYRNLGEPLASPLLDLGCGDGGMAHALAAAGLTGQPPCGVDIGNADLLRARRSGAHRHLIRADARQLPFRDGHFATVLANGVLCCIPQGLDGTIAEVCRVLRPGGLLAACVPTDAFVEVLLPTRLLGALSPGLARLYARRVNARLHHATALAVEGWSRLFEGHGLVVQRCEPLFSRTAAGPWSLLVSQPLRAFGLLRLPGLRPVGKPLSAALFARGFAYLYERDTIAGPPFGYVLIAARRRSDLTCSPRTAG